MKKTLCIIGIIAALIACEWTLCLGYYVLTVLAAFVAMACMTPFNEDTDTPKGRSAINFRP